MRQPVRPSPCPASASSKAYCPAAECPMRENKEYNKGIAPDPGSCTRDICGRGSRTGAFCLYTDRCRARRHSQRTVRTPEEPVLPTAIYPA